MLRQPRLVPVFFFAGSLFAVFFLAAPAHGEALEEEWFVARLQGRAVGTLQVVAQPRAEGGYAVRLTQKLRFTRVQTTIDVGVTLVVEEDAAGRFAGFAMRQELAQNAVELSGEVREGRLFLRERSAGGAERTSEIEVPAGAVGVHRSEEILCESLRTFRADPGAPRAVETVLFNPELRRFGKQTTTFGPVEELRVGGDTRKLRRVEVTQEALPGMIVTQWVNDDCEEERFVFPLFGMELEFERTKREDALAIDLRSPPEILLASAVRVTRHVPRDCAEARYRLRLGAKSGRRDWKGVFTAAGQDVAGGEGSEVILVVRKVVPPRTARIPPRGAGGERGYIEEDLAANAYIQADDPAIRKLAREIVAEAANRWAGAVRLESWVRRNITRKNLETAFATAREVLDSRTGDCTEHAVLLAALCRAADIPARIVAGLVYHDGAFIGHMWTQVHVGAWVPLDATIGRGEVGADHIAFSTSALGSDSLAELFVDLAQLLGHVEIEVLETR